MRWPFASWVRILFLQLEKRSEWEKIWISEVNESCSVVSDSLQPPWNSPGQNTGVGSLFLLQGIFPTQGLNSGFPHCRQILYQLSHKESLRILEGGGSLSLFQQIFLTQGLNWDLLHCGQILYQLSYEGTPREKPSEGNDLRMER